MPTSITAASARRTRLLSSKSPSSIMPQRIARHVAARSARWQFPCFLFSCLFVCLIALVAHLSCVLLRGYCGGGGVGLQVLPIVACTNGDFVKLTSEAFQFTAEDIKIDDEV